MRRPSLLLGVLMLSAPLALAAQGSQFGVRGLGFPGRALTAKALSTGGTLGMFEGESSRNPAALSLLTATTTVFTSTSAWRTSANPLAESSSRDTRFPQLSVGGHVPGTAFYAGFSHSLYTDRDFTAVSQGIAVPRGDALLYTDSLSSRGGISDLRLSAAWRPEGHFIALGGGIDFLTGQNQLTTRRVWEDTLYLPTKVGGEVSFRSVGFTVGALLQPTSRLQLSASAQYLGSLEVRQDSLDVRTHIPMPMTLTAAARTQVGSKIHVAGMVTSRNWARANDALSLNGGTGAQSTFEMAGGLELTRNIKVPDQLPLRLGIRRSDLPFTLEPGDKARETAFSVGTGMRFANQGGGIDFSLERATRKEGSSYTETAWHFSIGITVRTSGGGR